MKLRCNNTFRRCFTGKCVKFNKNKSYNKKRCKIGTRKCGDRHCYRRKKVEKYIYPKRILHKQGKYDLNDFKKSSSDSKTKKYKPIKYKFVAKVNKNKRHTLDDWGTESDFSSSK